MLKVLRIIAGVFLLIVGFVALVTPLTPGAWLGLIGLELLGWGFLIPERIRKIWKKKSTKNGKLTHLRQGSGGQEMEDGK